jgi:SAM-dependent methyltransferase
MSDRRTRHIYEECPLCSAPDIEVLRQADCSKHALYTSNIPATMTWMRCDDCSHVFTEGYWTKELLETIFAKTHDNQRPGADMERQRMVSAKMVDRVVSVTGPPKTDDAWLDVGFGNGSLLFTASEYGFRPVGLDLRPDSAAVLNRIGIEAHCCDLTDFADPRGFAVISMADVLEHMPFPKKGLTAARKLLTDNGVLFISLPATDSPLWGMWNAQGVNPYWGEIEHYHNFTRERLYALLRETFFEPVIYGVSERYRGCMEVIARAV